ncbi:hypothetical protein CEXT_269771 [Caerostris extrusa]|uniref:Uncharacterized protein n=1 Tax=Caerostris extrusa TaxID=172846 RepID=A0AAV4PGM5_CAEEX|nr:hypothetical protein CEXT_269771 [Caerostris extrusa]
MGDLRGYVSVRGGINIGQEGRNGAVSRYSLRCLKLRKFPCPKRNCHCCLKQNYLVHSKFGMDIPKKDIWWNHISLGIPPSQWKDFLPFRWGIPRMKFLV